MTTYPLERKKAVQHSTSKPPVWDALTERFNQQWERTAVAYGDTIHALHPLPADVEVHERVHLHQHGYTQEGAAAWWERYLNDPQFRLEQELEAYAEQYRFLANTIKDRNQLARTLHKLAGDLAGMYELPITRSEAMQLIKNHAPTTGRKHAAAGSTATDSGSGSPRNDT